MTTKRVNDLAVGDKIHWVGAEGEAAEVTGPWRPGIGVEIRWFSTLDGLDHTATVFATGGYDVNLAREEQADGPQDHR